MTSPHTTAPNLPEAHDRAYNLFRNREFPELVCAVPEDCSVPGFIGPEQWTFDHPLRPAETRPPGFYEKAAKSAVQFNGFYLFYAIASAPAVQTTLEMLGKF